MNPVYDLSRENIAQAYNVFNRLPTRRKNPNIVKYAEKTIIPSGPYRGQKFRHSVAPYLKEPLKLLSPESLFREIVLMFPAQTGKSTDAELTCMYYITKVPSEIIYATANETAAIKWLERRIVPRAAEAGVEFKAEVQSRTSRKTGDTSYSKLFPGGNIDIASALSPAQLAQETKRIVIGDEVDRWRIILGDEGSVLEQLRARTQAWGDLSKILWISTPTTEENSAINFLFMLGDQRYFYVPCPYCGTMQILDFHAGRGHGLKWEYKYNRILKKSIVFVCESQTCQREIREFQKHKMLNGGKWRKSAIPEFEYIASFNINGLYSPLLSWYEMAISFDKAQKDPLQKQAHENLKMGRAYKETGRRPKAEKLIENRGKYKPGTIPDGVLYLTMMIDVQRGSDDPLKNNPPRIELEVLGIGAGYRSWSILYKRIEGQVENAWSGAWEMLDEWARETKLTFYRNDGFGFPVQLTFIDSGDGETRNVVYEFCQRWDGCFPSKGFSALKKRKKEKGDEQTPGDFRRYRAQKMNEDITLYEISTNWYKNIVYNNLNIARQEIEPQRPGFCDFPIDYDEKYFNMLTAEEKHRDGSFHNPTGRRNEALDCRVGCLCAADVWLDSELYSYRADAKSRGLHPQEILKITHKTVIEIIAQKTACRKVK